MSAQPADAVGGSGPQSRPAWAWLIVVMVGVVVAVMAVPYGAIDGARAVPAVAARVGAKGRRGWFVTALWFDERWRRRHRVARAWRHGVEDGGRRWRRFRRVVGKNADTAARRVRRGASRMMGRPLRRTGGKIRAFAGGVKRRLRDGRSEE